MYLYQEHGVTTLSEELQEVGSVSHFFTKISVAIIELTDTLSVGDRIRITGPTTYLDQQIESMEIEHEKVQKAQANQSVGLVVKERVRKNDVVYKIV